MASPKMGRPTDSPKDRTLFIRLDNESSETLETYCEQERVTKTGATRRGVKKLRNDLKKREGVALTHQSKIVTPPKPTDAVRQMQHKQYNMRRSSFQVLSGTSRKEAIQFYLIFLVV